MKKNINKILFLGPIFVINIFLPSTLLKVLSEENRVNLKRENNIIWNRVNIDDSIILDRAAGKATKPEFIPPNFRQYMSFGSDINYEYSNGLESIAFKGLMD